MLKNYFTIALRHLTNKKLYGIINITGLALGLASSFVIGTWVYQELSYDRHFENSEHIYRVGVNFYNVGDMAPGPEIFSQVAGDFPEVSRTTSINSLSSLEIGMDGRKFEENRAFAADDDFFEMFSYRFLQGDSSTALDQPGQAVLTESMAKKIFNSVDVLGRNLLIGEDEIPHTVVGVVEDMKQNTHFTATMWITLERDPERTSWTSAHYHNYVQLKPEFGKADLQNRLDQLIRDRIYPSLNTTQPYDEWVESSSTYYFIVTPLTDLYLKTNLRFEFFTGGNATNVYAFAAIALFIILLAAINFVNISTARSSGRAREVGIRKTLGSGRKSIILQFLSESLLTGLLALFLALGLGEVFLVLFEKITGIHLLESLFIGPEQILVFIAIAAAVGLTAGLYPALYMSSFHPIAILKNHVGGVKKSWFRNGLVVTQFTISICLIIAAVVVYQQIQYLQSRDLGLEAENVLVIENASVLADRSETFIQEIKNIPGVRSASYNRRIPASSRVLVRSFRTPAMSEGKPFQIFFGDDEFLHTMGFHLLEGRNFSQERASDTAAVILNRSAARELELDDPVGAKLNDNLEVIGVVGDFNFENLHSQVEPAAIMFSQSADRMAIKVDGVRTGEILASLQELWKSHQISESISYYFLDDRFQATLENERSLGRAIILFVLFAVIISSLGLYGLSAFICDQRTKEIGIRKVLGATVSSLVVFLNREFTKPVLISIALAVPLSYFVMSRWLSNFAYRVEIDPLVYLLAGLTALVISWLTVSGQSIRTAVRNPVDSLRSE